MTTIKEILQKELRKVSNYLFWIKLAACNVIEIVRELGETTDPHFYLITPINEICWTKGICGKKKHEGQEDTLKDEKQEVQDYWGVKDD